MDLNVLAFSGRQAKPVKLINFQKSLENFKQITFLKFENLTSVSKVSNSREEKSKVE